MDKLSRDQDFVGLHAHRDVTARVAARPTRDRIPRGNRGRRIGPVKPLVLAPQQREQIARVAGFAQPPQHRFAGLIKEILFLVGKLSAHGTAV